MRPSPKRDMMRSRPLRIETVRLHKLRRIPVRRRQHQNRPLPALNPGPIDLHIRNSPPELSPRRSGIPKQLLHRIRRTAMRQKRKPGMSQKPR
jgi:hypothetical protein